MKYRELGRSGIKVSAIGIGTWQWGTKYWGYGKSYTKEDLYRAFKRALDLGINFFDTAEVYGLSERLLGEFIGREGREGLVIATKVWPWHATFEGTIKAAERSLKKLRIEYIDLYQVHWPNPLISLNETMKAFDKLFLEGKVRAAGLSNFGVKGVTKARKALEYIELVSDQVEYNMLERGVEKELLPYLQKEGITLIAYSPLAQGLLAGKLMRPKDFVRMVNPFFSGYNLKRIRPLIGVLRRIAEERGVSIVQVSLNWLLSKKGVVPIPGVKNEGQVVDIAETVSWNLKGSELKEIEETLGRIRISKLIGYLTVPLRLIMGPFS